LTPFLGDSDMAARCRAFDWASTPLGPVSGWSQSLRTTVSTMLESRHPMFLWWGPELIQIYNDGYLPSFGNTGRDVTALGQGGRDHWAEIWEIIGPQIEQVMATGEATWHEDHLVPITRNGQVENVYWTYGYSPVRDDDGSIGGILVVVQETTRRVHALAQVETARADAETARAHLSELFRQAPAFIAVLRGQDLIFELANDFYYQLIGRRDIIGKTLLDALPDIRGQGWDVLLRRVIETGTTHTGDEVPLLIERTPGIPEQRYVTFVYAPLMEADGSRSGVFVHGVDVTEQVRNRREIEAARADAEEARTAAEVANRSKSEFLAAMSHELRTPLNAIAGYAQLIELGVYGEVTDAQRDALERIQRSEQHLLSLVNDVLNFAKLEAGRIEYDMSQVALADVVAAATPMVEPQFRAKGITYRVDVPNDVIVNVDREKLQQILLNLLSNAIKFTGDGGNVWVDIGRRTGAPAEVVCFRVSDSGLGIPREKQDEIFDPFVQLHRNLTRSSEGVGLGLAISRDLARGMGGDLRVRSIPGQGSTFTLTIQKA
jgi:signal transduction histidine kinase